MPGEGQALKKRCHCHLRAILSFIHSTHTNEHLQVLPSLGFLSESPTGPLLSERGPCCLGARDLGMKRIESCTLRGVTSPLKTFWSPGLSFSFSNPLGLQCPLDSVTVSLEEATARHPEPGCSCCPSPLLLTVDAHHQCRPRRRGEVKLFPRLLCLTVKIPGLCCWLFWDSSFISQLLPAGRRPVGGRKMQPHRGRLLSRRASQAQRGKKEVWYHSGIGDAGPHRCLSLLLPTAPSPHPSLGDI